METFKASNGALIELTNAGKTGYMLAEGDESGATGYLGFEQMVASREFFLHERDQELGRWRCENEPEWVAYPGFRNHAGSRTVRVLNELNGFSTTFAEYNDDDDFQGTVTDGANIAIAYFKAHREKKPWHDAKPGEVWVLTGTGGLEQPWRRMDTCRWISCTTGMVEYNDEHAIAGRRLWPEVVSDA